MADIGKIFVASVFFLGAILLIRIFNPMAQNFLDLFSAGMLKFVLTVVVYMIYAFFLFYLPIHMLTKPSGDYYGKYK